MQRSIIDLPCGVLGAVVRNWHLDVRGRAASDSVDGSGQVVYGVQPRWMAELTIPVAGRERVLSFRALAAQLRGRVNLLRVCLCDPYAPTIRAMSGTAHDGLPYSDGTLHSDGTGFETVPVIALTAPLAEGVETIAFDATTVAGLVTAGQYVSIDDWLYMIRSLEGEGADSIMTIEPPLRRAALAGDEIRLKAQSIMALTSDAETQLSLASAGRMGEAKLQLVEWLNR
jgi:hypothetical protein